MRKTVLFSLLFFSFGQVLFGQNVQKSIDSFVADADFKHTNIGIHVMDLQTGKVLGGHESEESMVTASVLKVLTTATVMEQRGAEYRYTTEIAYTGNLQQGKLFGDIVIKGSGDPTFNSKFFPGDNAVLSVLSAIRKKGINEIDGDLILDVSAFASEVPRTWTWEDIGNYYGAVPSAINYADNFYTLTFQTGKAGTLSKIITIKPEQKFSIDNQVYASKINADRAYIFGSPINDVRVVQGTLPENRKAFSIKGAMPNPALSFGEAVQKELANSGIRLKGKLKFSRKAVENTQKLGVVISPKLQAIATETNRKSINLFAEALLHIVQGAKENSSESRLEAIKAFWQNKGIDTKGLYLHDGSGLSHFNAVPPRFFTELLNYMHQSSQGKAFKATLATSGKNGTLVHLGKGTALAGKVYGKSGSMKQVYCYVGYLTTKSGEEVTFAVMLNNFDIPSYKIRQKIAELLMQW